MNGVIQCTVNNDQVSMAHIDKWKVIYAPEDDVSQTWEYDYKRQALKKYYEVVRFMAATLFTEAKDAIEILEAEG